MKPTDQNRLGELIGKMEAATTDGDVRTLTQDDVGAIYSWLMWAIDQGWGTTQDLCECGQPDQTRRVTRRLRLNLWPIVILLLSPLAFADQWTYFYPQSVTSLSCKAELVDLQLNGSAEKHNAWEATASAKRNDKSLGDWQMTIGQFPPTLKGRHDAEKACSKWMDEASKRVKAGK